MLSSLSLPVQAARPEYRCPRKGAISFLPQAKISFRAEGSEYRSSLYPPPLTNHHELGNAHTLSNEITP